MWLADFLYDIKKSKNLVHLSRIASNPSIRDVYECLKLLNGTNPDVIIALGGGSCIDLARLSLHCMVSYLMMSYQSNLCAAL